MKNMKTIVISLGGSLIAPDGLDPDFLKGFVSLISSYKDRRFIIVTGGGMTSRVYQRAAKEIGAEEIDLDWIGIAATKLNAHLLRSIFGSAAYDEVLDNPEEFIDTNKNILIGSGYRPGCSSDKDAVLLAKTYSAKTVINLTNVDYVYDKNPKEFKDAKAFETLSWVEFLKIFADDWRPGLHAPFDPIAAKVANDLGLRVIIANGGTLDNIRAVIEGKEYNGTTIS